jgi:hypothetical protein
MPGNNQEPHTVAPRDRARPRRRCSALIAATVVLALAGRSSSSAPNPEQTRAPSTASADGVNPPSTAQLLQQLASSISPLPTDGKDPRRYAYSATRVQSWKPDTTMITGTDTTVWRAADGTGRRDTRRLSVRAEHTGMPSPGHRRRLATAAVTTEDYRRPGQLPGTIREPVPRDPATLATGLAARQPAGTSPGAVIQAYSDLARYHYLDRDARAACLRMLATIEQLRYDGIAKDLHGRTGIAFAVDSAHHRDTILIDASTGRLLARSQTRTTSPATLTEHSIYLGSDRTTTAGMTPATTAVLAAAAPNQSLRRPGHSPNANRAQPLPEHRDRTPDTSCSPRRLVRAHVPGQFTVASHPSIHRGHP